MSCLFKLGNTVQHCLAMPLTHGNSFIGLDGNRAMFMHLNIGESESKTISCRDWDHLDLWP